MRPLPIHKPVAIAAVTAVIVVVSISLTRSEGSIPSIPEDEPVIAQETSSIGSPSADSAQAQAPREEPAEASTRMYESNQSISERHGADLGPFGQDGSTLSSALGTGIGTDMGTGARITWGHGMGTGWGTGLGIDLETLLGDDSLLEDCAPGGENGDDLEPCIVEPDSSQRTPFPSDFRQQFRQ